MRTIRLSVAVSTLLVATSLYAESDESHFKLSGFASLVVGAVISGTENPGYSIPNYSHPGYIADWYNLGVYGTNVSARPESRIGVQGAYQFTNEFSATVQVTSRGVVPKPNLEWAFLSHKFGTWELQVGRKRIPLYYYSAFQDVGIAYPWISPPPELYGWEVNNFNGASLRYHGFTHGVGYTASVFGGSEKVKEARFFKHVTFEPVDVEWKNLIGADLELSKDWWTVRFVYVKNDVLAYFREFDAVGKQHMRARGVAFNADFEDWFLLSEIGENDRTSPDGSSFDADGVAYNIGVGRRIGKWTLFLCSGAYDEKNVKGRDVTLWRTQSATVRYDITSSNAVKVQWTYNKDVLHNFTGNASLLRVSYDTMF